jgi:hypothetical protein
MGCGYCLTDWLGRNQPEDRKTYSDLQQTTAERTMKIKTRIKAGTFQVGDNTLTIDEDGFIQEPERWNDDVAKVTK